VTDSDQLRLDAVIMAVTEGAPRILTVHRGSGGRELPSVSPGPDDRTLELALRRGIGEQTGLDVGYAEQLYTFGDLGRVPGSDVRLVSVAYLALIAQQQPSTGATWSACYSLLPWEDHRDGPSDKLAEEIVPRLDSWVNEGRASKRGERRMRVDATFGLHGAPWDGVRVLERYELLYEIGLLAESSGDWGLGEAMAGDHRRIVASALGRLRGKLTYRPTVFELLADRFTLSQLQALVEALSGVRLHKQNFRRLIEQGGLVEGTGETTPTAGRPAELFTFRREVLTERPRPGVGTPWSSGS
jgi:hypothetical protein